MDCTEAYKEHIMYSFNGFCKVVIRYAAINAWRDRNRRRQKEISFESQEGTFPDACIATNFSLNENGDIM